MKRSQLRPDPEKVRAWQRRSRERAARDKQPTPRKPKARIPVAVRAEVRARTANRCAACLLEGAPRPRRVAHLHHVMDESAYPRLATLPENLIGLCVEHHMAHEFPGVRGGRLPLAVLPACTVELAEREGLGWYLRREYA